MISPWWRNRFNNPDPKGCRSFDKLVAWLLVMFVMFEIGLQLGMAEGRKLGRLEAKQETLEKYQKIVKDAGYYSVK